MTKLERSKKLAVLIFCVLSGVAFIIGYGLETKTTNLIFVVCGGALGWLVGTAISPYTRKEGETFPKYIGAVSAFLSGYVLSKFDLVLDELLKMQDVIFSPTGTFRLLGGLSAFVTALLVVYISREYDR